MTLLRYHSDRISKIYRTVFSNTKNSLSNDNRAKREIGKKFNSVNQTDILRLIRYLKV